MNCACGTEIDAEKYASAESLKARVEAWRWPEGTTITLSHWHILTTVSVTVNLPDGKWFQWDDEEEFVAWSRKDKV